MGIVATIPNQWKKLATLTCPVHRLNIPIGLWHLVGAFEIEIITV
jgi:hypothetical protein